MSKKVIKGIAILIAIIVVILTLKTVFLIIKANYLYGDKVCQTEHLSMSAPDVIVLWKCSLCGFEKEQYSARDNKLCGKCSFITGRCYYCGGLLK